MMPALDTRQRAMLAEMGVRVWQPTDEVPPTPVAAPILAADPAPRLGHLPDGLSQMDWPSLKNAAAECRACGLCEHRQQSVFAEGAPVEGQRTDWLIIGDAPNDNENTSGRPFSGPEADLLDAMLLAMGLRRPTVADSSASVVLVNALKCKPPAQRKASWLRTIQAVLWSFVGLRKNSEYQQDIEKLNPFHIIGVAIGAALLFVLGLIALVNWVVVQPTGL